MYAYTHGAGLNRHTLLVYSTFNTLDVPLKIVTILYTIFLRTMLGRKCAEQAKNRPTFESRVLRKNWNCGNFRVQNWEENIFVSKRTKERRRKTFFIKFSLLQKNSWTYFSMTRQREGENVFPITGDKGGWCQNYRSKFDVKNNNRTIWEIHQNLPKFRNVRPIIIVIVTCSPIKAFLIWAYPGLFLFIFVLFTPKFNYKLKKCRFSCLRFEPRAVGW